MGDEVQAIKAGLLEVADIVVVNKGDQPGAQRTASQLRAMLVAVGGIRDGARQAPTAATAAPERPRPKEPEVLVTTATTGDGLPELLATLDRHRARGREASDTPARLARAEAQVWAILADRLRGRLATPARTPRDDDAAHCARSPRTSSIRSRRRSPARARWPRDRAVDGWRRAGPPLVTRPFLAARGRDPRVLRRGRDPAPATPLFTRSAPAADGLGVGIAVASFAVASLVTAAVRGLGIRPIRPSAGAAARRHGPDRRRAVGPSPRRHRPRRSSSSRAARSGAAKALFFVAAIAAATDLAPEHRRGEAISLISLSLYLGIAIGPYLARRCCEATGASPAVWLVTAVALASPPSSCPGSCPRRAPRVARSSGRHRASAAGPPDPPGRRLPGDPDPARPLGHGRLLAFLPLYSPGRSAPMRRGPPLAVFAIVVVGLRIVGATLAGPDRCGRACPGRRSSSRRSGCRSRARPERCRAVRGHGRLRGRCRVHDARDPRAGRLGVAAR